MWEDVEKGVLEKIKGLEQSLEFENVLSVLSRNINPKGKRAFS